jgi:predicted phosphoadenosine phosphosulfate sulfurtransferase
MLKKYLETNVLEETQNRIAYVFDSFEKIYLSFSAGKDSTTMLHLVCEEARKRNRKIGLLLIDLEAQFDITMKHAEILFDMYSDIVEPYWVSLPIHLRNAVSVYEPFWMCWDPEAKDAWVRKPPKFAITDESYFPFFWKGMEFEEFVPLFGEWYSEGKSCACFVGIRTDESLNRFRTIAISQKETLENLRYTTRVTDNCYNIYPIYDWRVEDIWTYHGKNPDKPYNTLYDLMHKAGLTLSQMRICQPYGDDQRRNLWLFHIIEPETWARVVARVNGANGGALYIQEWGNVNGYRKITKPKGHTWKSFAKLLVASMPPKSRIHYRNKILLFEKWWIERGYSEGIPDAADYSMEANRKAPSWRRVCKSLLRNDYWCKGLGFSQQKSAAYEKYLKLMEKRKKEWNVNQMELGFVNGEIQC